MAGMSGVGVFWAVLSIVSALFSSVGFFMPHWIRGHLTLNFPEKSTQTFPVHFGIFRRCNYPAMGSDGKITMIMECGRYTTFADIPSVSWQIATLIIGLGCGLCFLVALTSVFGICVKGIVIATVARSAGILQICSGLLMAAGVGIYPNGWDAPEVQQACGFTSKSYSLGDCSLSWCFYVTSAGILVTLMCAALAFHAPKQKQFMAGYSLRDNLMRVSSSYLP